MATKIHDKPVSLAEERAAAKAEQKRDTKPISAAGLKKARRAHELKRLMAPLKAELEELKVGIFKEMDNKGVDVLTRAGVEVVSRDDFDSVSVEREKLETEHPEIAALYVHHKPSTRINWKNEI